MYGVQDPITDLALIIEAHWPTILAVAVLEFGAFWAFFHFLYRHRNEALRDQVRALESQPSTRSPKSHKLPSYVAEVGVQGPDNETDGAVCALLQAPAARTAEQALSELDASRAEAGAERYAAYVEAVLNQFEASGACVIALCADKGLEKDRRNTYFGKFYDWAENIRAMEDNSENHDPGIGKLSPSTNRIRLCRLFLDWDVDSRQWMYEVIQEHHRHLGSGVLPMKIPDTGVQQIMSEQPPLALALKRKFGFLVFLSGVSAVAITHCGGKEAFTYRTLKHPIHIYTLMSLFKQLTAYVEYHVPEYRSFYDYLHTLRPRLHD